MREAKRRQSRPLRLAAAACAAGLVIPLFGSAASLPSSAAPAVSTAEAGSITAAQFKDPSQKFKPSIRWWWTATLSVAETERELQAIADQGFGAVEIAFTTGGWANEAQRANLRAALALARKLGIDVSMTMGAAWPVQTPNTSTGTPYVQKELQYGYTELKGGAPFNGAAPKALDDPTSGRTMTGVKLVGASAAKVKTRHDAATLLPQAERPRFGTPIKSPSKSTVLEAGSLVDLTSSIGTDGTITWTPPDGDDWMLFTYWERDAVKPVTSAFAKDGAAKASEYLDEYQVGNGKQADGVDNSSLLGDVGDSMFEDSLELNADSLFWSEDFQREFEKRFGYSMTTYLPFMFQHGMSRYWVPTTAPAADFDLDDGEGEKVRNDYYKLLTDLYIERMGVFVDWAKKYDMTYKAQAAFGQDLDAIRSARELAEMGGRVEGESYNSGDRFPVNIKNYGWRQALDWQRFVSSGAHQGGTNRVSTELGAQRDYTRMVTIGDYKEMMDKEWAAGFTMPVVHGFSYQSGGSAYPTGTAWPGAARFGDTTTESWNDLTFPQWSSFKTLTKYWSRGNMVLETGTAKADVVVLRSSTDFLTTAARTATDDGAQDARQFDGIRLEKRGYTLEYIDPEGLAEDGAISQGQLFAKGPGYRALVVDERSVPVETAEAIKKAADSGVKVVFVGQTPTTATSLKSGATGDQKVKDLIASALASPSSVKVATQADVADALDEAGMNPRVGWKSNSHVLTQLRQIDGVTYAYMYNPTNDKIDFSPSFEGTGLPQKLDLASGDIENVGLFSAENGRTVIPTTLGAKETAVYALDSTKVAPLHVVSSSNSDDRFEFGVGTIKLKTAQAGTRTIKLSDGTTKKVVANPVEKTQANTGPFDWSISVDSYTKDGITTLPTQPLTTFFNQLYGWKSIKSLAGVSGVGTYNGTVTVPDDWKGDGKGVYLTLGRISGGTAELFVNDQRIGQAISSDVRWDVSSALKGGKNAIKIVFRTTLRNAVTAGGTGQLTQETGVLGPFTFDPYASVTVYDQSDPVAPTIGQQPASVTVKTGKTTSFTASANGSPPPTVRWQSARPGGAWQDVPGGQLANGVSVLTVAGVKAGASGTQYRAIFENIGGSVASAPATLTVSTTTRVTVKSKRAPLKAKASSKSKTVATAKKGKSWTVVKKVDRKGAQNDWYQISSGGKLRWIKGTYVTVTTK